MKYFEGSVSTDFITRVLVQIVSRLFQVRVAYNYKYEDEAEATCYRAENAYWQYDVQTYVFPFIMSKRLACYNYDSGTSVSFAVSGIFLTRDQFDGKTFSFFKDCFSKEITCYFLDEGGFIVRANLETRPPVPEELQNKFAIGANLYSKDPCLMRQLVHDGIYKQVQVVKPMCSCQPNELFNESSCEVLSNMVKTFLATFWMLLQSLAQVAVPSFTHLCSLFFAPSFVEPLEKGPSETHMCQRQRFFQFFSLIFYICDSSNLISQPRFFYKVSYTLILDSRSILPHRIKRKEICIVTDF